MHISPAIRASPLAEMRRLNSQCSCPARDPVRGGRPPGPGFRPLPVGARNSVASCDLGVFVKEAAELVASDDSDVVTDGVGERPERTGLVQCPMRPVPVEMGLVLVEGLAQ